MALFCNAAILSIIFLTIISLLQYLNDPSAFRSVDWTFGEVAICFVCALWNIVVDWLSIGQTQFLLALAAKQRNVGRSLALIVMDFVLTINIFTLTYSIGIAAVFLVFYSHQQNAVIEADISQVSVSPKTVPINSMDQSHGAFLGSNVKNYFVGFRNFYGSSGSPTGSTAGLATINFLANTDTITLADVVLISNRISRWKLLRATVVDPPYANPQSFPQWTTQVAEITQSSPPPWIKVESALGAAYTQVETVQSGFPTSLSMHAQFFDLPVMSGLYGALSATSRASGIPLIAYACENIQHGKEQWDMQFSPVLIQGPCQAKVSISSLYLVAIAAAAHMDTSMQSNLQIPLNTLFMTSTTMTAIVYWFALTLVIGKMLTAIVFHFLGRRISVFERAPFAASELIVGALLFLLVA